MFHWLRWFQAKQRVWKCNYKVLKVLCKDRILVVDLKVIGVDFCARYLDIANKLKQSGSYSFKINGCQVEVKNESIANNITFKQLTWIPNEISPSELVLFTMIDRCINPICRRILFLINSFHISFMFSTYILKHG